MNTWSQDANGSLGSTELGVLARLRPVGPYFAGDLRVAWRGDTADWRVLGASAWPEAARAVGLTFDLYSGVAATSSPPQVALVLADDDGREVVRRTLSTDAVNGGWRMTSEIGLDSLAAGAYTVSLAITTDGVTAPPVTSRIVKVTPAKVDAALPTPSRPAMPTRADALATLQSDLRASWPRFSVASVLTPVATRAQLSSFARDAGVVLPAALVSSLSDDGWWASVEMSATGTSALSELCRGLVALRAGEPVAAEAALLRALAAVPASSVVMELLGAGHALRGRDGDAIGSWEMASGAPSARAEFSLALAEALGREGDLGGAFDTLKRLPGDTPGSIERVVEALVLLGRFEDARASVEDGLRRSDVDRDRLLFLAVVLAFGDAVDVGATDAARTAFAAAATRYLDTSGPQADTVRWWVSALVP